jgi:hypothetical protein
MLIFYSIFYPNGPAESKKLNLEIRQREPF